MIPLVLALVLLGPERTIENVHPAGGFALARSARTTMLAWSDGARVHVAPVAGDWTIGRVTTLPSFVVGASGILPAIASDGDGFLVAWQENATRTTMYVTMRIDARGEPLAVLPTFVGQTIEQYPARPTVSWSADQYLVGWSGQLARFDARGLLLSAIDDARARSEGAVSVVVATSGDARLTLTQRQLAGGGCSAGVGPPRPWAICDPLRYTIDAEFRGQNTTLVPPTTTRHRTFAAGGPAGFAIAYSDTETLTTIDVTRDGRYGAPRSVAGATLLALAGGGDRTLAVWRDTAFRGRFGGETFLIAGDWPLEASVLEIGDAFAVAWVRSGRIIVRDTIPARRRPAR